MSDADLLKNKKLAVQIIDEIDADLMQEWIPGAKAKAAVIVERWLDHRDRCAAKQPTTWLGRLIRRCVGGIEYGRLSGDLKSDRIYYRRDIRTGKVEMRRPMGWIEIHRDHWSKFVSYDPLTEPADPAA